MRLSNGEGRLEDLPASASGCARAGGLPLRCAVVCSPGRSMTDEYEQHVMDTDE